MARTVTHRKAARGVRGRLGEHAEDHVARHLVANGWVVLDRNWCADQGEIDIVALDPDGVCVFVEVKARRGEGFGPPLAAITNEKIARVAMLGSAWLREQRLYPAETRVDGVGVLMRPGHPLELTHVRGLTQWGR